MAIPFLALIDPISKLLDRLIPDKAALAQAKLDLLKEENAATLAEINAAAAIDVAQIAVNTEEAKNENLFVSGARPFIMWVCGFAFAYKFIVQPFLIFGLVAAGSKFDYHSLPALDWTELSTVLLGVLGLGYQRSMDKKNGV